MSINWRGEIEWSDGSPVTFAPYDNPADGHRSVTACPKWYDITGDTHVAVDAKTGDILGCEDDGYPHVRNVIKQPPVWLHLFHGRASMDEQLDGWGFNGPCIGPLNYVHITYMCDVKFGFQDQHDAAKFGLSDEGHLKLKEDCVELDGKFYGDFSINAFPCEGLYRIDDGDKFEATMHDAIARLQPGQKLVDMSGDGETVVAHA